MATYNEAIDTIETALRERYHVPTLEGVGALGAAIAAAREHDLAPLDIALAGRELYRWGPVVTEALAAAHAAAEGESAEQLPVVTEDEAPLAEESHHLQRGRRNS